MISRREITVAGENLWFCGMSGVVAGEKKWSETRVQSTPGTAYTHSRIDTKVSTRHEFWLVAPDGEERCVELGNSQVSVREGQILTAIWGASSTTQTGPFLLLRNNNAQTITWLIPDAPSMLRRMKLSDPAKKFTFIGVGGGLLLFLLAHSLFGFLLFLAAAVGGSLYGAQKRKEKVGLLRQAVTEALHLELSESQGREVSGGVEKGRLPG